MLQPEWVSNSSLGGDLKIPALRPKFAHVAEQGELDPTAHIPLRLPGFKGRINASRGAECRCKIKAHDKGAQYINRA